MSHVNQNSPKLFARLNRIKGQVEALDHALKNGVACSAFLHQVASVRGAIDGLMSEALEGHIREHLGENSHTSEERQQDLDEVINVLKTYLK
ncbi:metal/formaldehyde-sensitive transcriptional repressor [Methylotenera mobilis]|uniref:Metal/formaldehyde-sensitive transcriptional repressor n=1 Tax=Methylotenera mobilis (strain JLW8 / ATCC BAA-1282 / DSM 17540) TaxID=583345 RepID=C6WY13_METML|nr:metal/formaldehyde-sensitive transcriptional repressor [Methylotenera mobilis]ACT48812.1 protein of unknown function DUF156 [Methylotenera mobilis JLW8]